MAAISIYYHILKIFSWNSLSFQTYYFFLKRTGRRAARYIKKKGARRARTKELALYKLEHRFSQKGERDRPANKEKRSHYAKSAAKCLAPCYFVSIVLNLGIACSYELVKTISL